MCIRDSQEPVPGCVDLSGNAKLTTPSVIEAKDYPPAISSFAFSDGGPEHVFVFIGGSEIKPADVYVASGVSQEPVELKPDRCRVKGWQYSVVSRRHTFKQVIRLTGVNDDVLMELNLSKPESFIFQSPDGLEIEGWMMKPIDFEPSKKYPAVLEIHGGPAVTYGMAFFHEFQVQMCIRDRSIAVGHGQGFEYAQSLLKLALEKLNVKGAPSLFEVGPVIGVHTGPGTVGIYARPVEY